MKPVVENWTYAQDGTTSTDKTLTDCSTEKLRLAFTSRAIALDIDEDAGRRISVSHRKRQRSLHMVLGSN
jgi:hypothetical protein